jgi:putative heme iron utilization protein
VTSARASTHAADAERRGDGTNTLAKAYAHLERSGILPPLNCDLGLQPTARKAAIPEKSLKMPSNPRFEAKSVTKTLLREARSGALGTLMAGTGDPYCSLVNVATAADGAPVILISQLALHTKNILADSRVSLMLDERKPGDPLEGTRVMLMGRAEPAPEEAVRQRYLARHPDAKGFVDFKDFGFYRMNIHAAHLVAGFGRIVDLEPQDILTNLADAEALVAAEAGICEHMNADHADAVRLYATKLLGAADGDWRCVGCDPEGLELQRERLALRLPFPQPVRAPGVLRQTLKQMAQDARAMA